jgi:hypothetical protein
VPLCVLFASIGFACHGPRDTGCVFGGTAQLASSFSFGAWRECVVGAHQNDARLSFFLYFFVSSFLSFWEIMRVF